MRRLRIVIGLVVVIVLGIWVASRWHTWFVEEDEEAYVLSQTPSNVLLTFGDALPLSRNVSWQADSVVRPSWLELVSLADSDTIRVEAQGEVFRSRGGQAAYYVARLRSLQAATSYAYRAVTGEKASPWYRFHTQSVSADQVSFLYVGDVQDSIGGEANRFLRETLSRHPESEFLVCGGDLADGPRQSCWEQAFRDIDSVTQAMPLMVVTGNHDYRKGVFQWLERRFPLTFSYFLDSKIADNQVYTLCYGPVQFFLLDSNRELPYLLTQREWLKAQLEQSRAPWKIVVLHHPLFSIKSRSRNLIQRWVFNGLLESFGVDLVLQAHEHEYARMTAHEGGQAVTPVYTISHCSPKNYDFFHNERYDKFGTASRYYQTVCISGDTLTLKAYEVYHHTLCDSLLIIKNASRKNKIVKSGSENRPTLY
ncbi:MAG: metallophosphoesterase family protein [Prevotella sp.]|nr:metallophosphoesterase family protein [Prevotella sp.]